MVLRYDTRSRVGQSVKNWINPSVTIEYLIIAGGGGGGFEFGGGGGAGGYLNSVVGETTGGGGSASVTWAGYDNTAGGGGNTSPTAGGNGKVIIRYLGAQRGSGGVYSSTGGYSYHTFTSSTAVTFTA